MLARQKNVTYSDYSFHVTDDVLFIIDQNAGRRSVTNDMENVLAEIQEHMILPALIVYRDSDLTYDGVRVKGRTIEFYGIGAKDEAAAISKAKELNGVQ